MNFAFLSNTTKRLSQVNKDRAKPRKDSKKWVAKNATHYDYLILPKILISAYSKTYTSELKLKY